MSAIDVAALSPRVAAVTHALLLAIECRDGEGLLTAAEICEYDSQALSARSTGAALTAARRAGLVSCMPGPDGNGLWWPTEAAQGARRALEDLVLSREDEANAAS